MPDRTKIKVILLLHRFVLTGCRSDGSTSRTPYILWYLRCDCEPPKTFSSRSQNSSRACGGVHGDERTLTWCSDRSRTDRSVAAAVNGTTGAKKDELNVLDYN